MIGGSGCLEELLAPNRADTWPAAKRRGAGTGGAGGSQGVAGSAHLDIIQL